MCYKVFQNYILRNQTTNEIVELNSELKYYKNDLYQAAMEYSKQYKEDTFVLFIEIKNEPCWQSGAACYQSYIDSKQFKNDVEDEYDYEETCEFKNGEWLDDF